MTKEPRLADITSHLDTQLQCHEFSHLDSALNGLQVGDPQAPIRSIAAAVDASLESLERATDMAADLLIVHHGIFWGRVEPISGPLYERLSLLLGKRLALYAAHLPLDAQMQYGNNIHLAESLNLQNIHPFGLHKNRAIGCAGEFGQAQSMDDICNSLEVSPNALRLEFSRKTPTEGIKTVGIVSGAGAFALEEAAAKGYDLLLTGEIAYPHYYSAKELGINVLAMGHYYSETGGVQRLLNMLQAQWPHLTTHFIDLPIGL
ncbi:MAG: Nif3-like dinuclear metal center hexameric protein [Spirochaetota bacterium]